MRFFIIGAGPGDPKLITLRGAELIASCPVVLYTGSLVPAEVVATAAKDALVLDSSGMTLDEILAVIVRARDAGHDVARVHTGDPSLFGSTAEQMRKMQELGIEYEIVPGVSSFSAAAAALGRELTLPELSQTVILTRAEGRTPMPALEKLDALAAHRATLCIFLSITLMRDVTEALIPAYGADCPVAVVHKASCPDQQIVLGTLGDIREKVRAAGIKSQAMILVGHVLTATDFANSKLYDPEFSHRFRRAVKGAAKPAQERDVSAGRVALVGAGPGDPALLTLRAAELLRVADVVAYDELVSEAILALVPETAELLPVGRRAGRGDVGHRLHPDVIQRAHRGLFVVRLKAGDPLVFGRGGEEAQALAEAGIPFEIVPGISAALGAAAYSAIPLTHRELSAQVILSTGHRGDGGAPPPDAKGGRTLSLYMATSELEANLASLVAAGWARETPAALVVAATTADERTITGTLATLAARAAALLASGSKLPALVFVGDVVGLRGEIDWRGRLPLRGRRVVVARARVGASSVARSLRTLGAEVIELPHVEREVLDASSALRKEVARGDYRAILVACDDGADALGGAGLGADLPEVIAIGAATATRLRAHGIAAHRTVRGACADALAVVEERLRGARVLVPAASNGRRSLEAELAALGATAHFVTVARDRHLAPARWPSRVDLVVLPASSAARALYAGAPAHVRAAKAVAMGARTLAEAERCGAGDVTLAELDTVESLVAAAVRALAHARNAAPDTHVQEVTP